MPDNSDTDDTSARLPMTGYAHFVQACRKEQLKKDPEENVIFIEFSKKCAEKWAAMSDEEKNPFHEKAEKEKNHYGEEVEERSDKTIYKRPNELTDVENVIKELEQPKKCLSAFAWFSNDERAKVKSENPEYKVGDVATELTIRWVNADVRTIVKYEDLAEKDKHRYRVEMKAYDKEVKSLRHEATKNAFKRYYEDFLRMVENKEDNIGVKLRCCH